MPSYGQGRDHPGPRRASFLHGFNLTDVIITGNNGTVDGQGQVWWTHHKSGNETYTRGHLFEVMWSRDVVLSSITLQNSPFWTVHPVYSVGFTALNLTILNPITSPNTDGIDPDSTKDVLIQNCYIRVGDDAIAIKSGWDQYGYNYNVSSSNITILDSIFISPCCAAICIGSEMSGGVSNVFASNITVLNSAEGLRLKTGIGRGGYISNITLANSLLNDNKVAFEYNEHYGGHPSGWSPLAIPTVSGIYVRNCTGTGNGQVADLEGLVERGMSGIQFEDITVTGVKGWECNEFVQGSQRNVVPPACPQLDQI